MTNNHELCNFLPRKNNINSPILWPRKFGLGSSL